MELAKYEGNVADLAIVSKGGIKVIKINDTDFVPLFDEVTFYTKFIQPGSAKKNPHFKGHAGEFYCSELEELDSSSGDTPADGGFSKTLRLLPIGLMGYTRVLMPTYDPNATDVVPLCASRDGVWPRGDIDLPVSAQCSTWGISKEGHPVLEPLCYDCTWVGKQKPACKVTENWMFMDMDRRCAIILPLSGVNIGSLRKLNKTVKALKYRAIIKGLDTTRYYIRVSSEEGSEPGFHQMVFNYETSEDSTAAEYLGAVAWCQQNVLPMLGTDPVNPRNETQMRNVGTMSAEDEAALQLSEATAANDAANFDV